MENQETQTQTIQLKPDFGSAFGHGWRMMMKYFLELLLVSLVVVASQIPMGLMQIGQGTGFSPSMALLQIFGIGYALFVIAPIDFGSKFMFLKAMRDKKFEIKEIFSGFKDNYLNIILANLLTIAIVVIGFIMLIIPGIIFAIKLAFVPYLVMDKNLDPVEAVKESWRMTRGYGWTIFGMGFVSIFIGLGGLLLLILGIIPATMWISSAFASLYHAVDMENNKPAVA
ncbi:MAG: hypothetical protein U9N53_02730 [Bacteroidota bacterium]|nr:hypothetical protein [Bacteroidota bacterium]